MLNEILYDANQVQIVPVNMAYQSFTGTQMILDVKVDVAGQQ